MWADKYWELLDAVEDEKKFNFIYTVQLFIQYRQFQNNFTAINKKTVNE